MSTSDWTTLAIFMAHHTLPSHIYGLPYLTQSYFWVKLKKWTACHAAHSVSRNNKLLTQLNVKSLLASPEPHIYGFSIVSPKVLILLNKWVNTVSPVRRSKTKKKDGYSDSQALSDLWLTSGWPLGVPVMVSWWEASVWAVCLITSVPVPGRYVSLSDNEKTAFRARELKSVHVDAVGTYLRLAFHRNYDNRYNPYSQVSAVISSVLIRE